MTVENMVGSPRSEGIMCEEWWFKVAPGRPLGADSSLAAQVLENAQVCMPWLPTSNCLDFSEKRTMKCCGKCKCSDCVCVQ